MNLSNIKQFFHKISNNKGFSLTEIITTIGIISAISTVSATQLDDVIEAARDAQRKANTRQVQTALNLYYDEHLEYPVSISNEPTQNAWENMALVLEDPNNTFMPEVPLDPLNDEKYNFKYWSDGQTFKITFETEDPDDASPVAVWGL